MRKLTFFILSALLIAGCDDVVGPEDLVSSYEMRIYVDDVLAASSEGTFAMWFWRESDVEIRIGRVRDGASLEIRALDLASPRGVHPVGPFTHWMDPEPGVFEGGFVRLESSASDRPWIRSQYATKEGSVTISRLYQDPDEDRYWIQGEATVSATHYVSDPGLEDAPGMVRIETSFRARPANRFRGF